jgi:hypothetical protein
LMTESGLTNFIPDPIFLNLNSASKVPASLFQTNNQLMFKLPEIYLNPSISSQVTPDNGCPSSAKVNYSVD